MAAHSTRSANDGMYFLHIEGLPLYFTWQDLKDLARKSAPHVAWTEMSVYRAPQPRPCGQVRVPRRKEAYELYNYITKCPVENKYPAVYLWDISNDKPKLIQWNTPNPPKQHQDFDRAMAARPDRWQPFGPRSPSAELGAYARPPAPLTSPAHGMQALSAHFANVHVSMGGPYRNTTERSLQLMSYTLPAAQVPAAPPMPDSHPSGHINAPSSGASVNTKEGFVQTERRTIHVADLDYDASVADVTRLLQMTGGYEAWRYVNPSNNTAILARYETNEAANEAITKLNGRYVGKRKIRVKLASDANRVRHASKAAESHARTLRRSGSKSSEDKGRKDRALERVNISRVNSPVIANGSRWRHAVVRE